MIRLISQPTEEASQRLAAARARFAEAIELGEISASELHARTKHDSIKESLVRETSGKCAYCESKIRHISYGDTEHIVPKSYDLDRALDYDNLTLACTICNTQKNDYYNPALPILDPYIDDPAHHLIATGPLIFRRPGSVRGRISVSVLKLNRTDLVDRRKDRLEALVPLIEQFALERDPEMKEAIARELRVEAAEDKEFSFAVSAFLQLMRDT